LPVRGSWAAPKPQLVKHSLRNSDIDFAPAVVGANSAVTVQVAGPVTARQPDVSTANWLVSPAGEVPQQVAPESRVTVNDFAALVVPIA
jgi:hypothetical protein